MARARGLQTLSIALSGDEPPSEFRLFVAGWNDTEHGRFLFDEQAAATVMAAAEKWGVDLAIDLEHQMLDGAGSDPTARDARGWFRLELRDDGSLWAVNVKWTTDGAQRLREKRQRYVSPAFEVDPETKRVTKIINVAITAIPATHDTPALVAASLGGKGMTLEEMMKVAEALDLGPDATFEDFMAKIDGLKSGAAEPAPQEPVEPTEPPAEEMGGAPPPPAEDDEEKAAVAASISRLTRITGKSTIGAAVDEVETWRASHLKLEAETQKLARERAALELNKRKDNAATLVKLGAETPHTSGLAKGKLVQRLLDEPLDEQNERVAALLAARGGKLPTEPKPPVKAATVIHPESGDREFQTPDGPVVLSARQLKICADTGAKPEEFAAKLAAKNKGRAGR